MTEKQVIFLEICNRIEAGVAAEDVWPLMRQFMNELKYVASSLEMDSVDFLDRTEIATLLPGLSLVDPDDDFNHDEEEEEEQAEGADQLQGSEEVDDLKDIEEREDDREDDGEDDGDYDGDDGEDADEASEEEYESDEEEDESLGLQLLSLSRLQSWAVPV
jgi:hypothetical protein